MPRSTDISRPTNRRTRSNGPSLPGLVVLLSTLWGPACGLLPSEVDVDLDYPLVVAGGLSSAQPDPLPGAGASVKQTLSNEGVPAEKVEAVRVTKLELVHLSPICEAQVGCELSFIDLLEVFVESPGIDRVRVGTLASPGTDRLASMDIDDVDLAPYVKAEAMTLVATIVLERRPIQDVHLEVRSTLRVEVDVVN